MKYMRMVYYNESEYMKEFNSFEAAKHYPHASGDIYEVNAIYKAEKVTTTTWIKHWPKEV